MIDYCDVSDLFYVWLKRILFDIEPELFGRAGLQDKADEIIEKRGGGPGEHRTPAFFQAELAKAFQEARRVLRSDDVLVVVYAHADPAAWVRLIEALHEAGFVVTSTWPMRTETSNTGVASIRVTVVIGCEVAPLGRPIAVASQVDREIVEIVKARIPQWERDGLALVDQMMAAFGPALEVYGRYTTVLQPDGTPAPVLRYLGLARTAAREAAALRIDAIPIEEFDTTTRFALFWMRMHGRTTMPKSEALFLAQADNLRLDQIRGGLLAESRGGYRMTLDPPRSGTHAMTAVFDVVRGMLAAWSDGGSEAVAAILAASERPPDDRQVWAVIAELGRLIPASDRDGRILAALQRNRGAIQELTSALTPERVAARQLDLFAEGKGGPGGDE